MKKLFSLLPLLIMSLHVAAQGADPIGSFNRYVIESWAGQYVRIGSYKVKGSPFLLGEPFPGKIKYNGDDFVPTAKILYNLVDQIAGPEVGPGQIFVADNKELEEFVVFLPEKFGGGQMHFKSGKFYGVQKTAAFYSVLAEGPVAGLLRYYKVQYITDPSNPLDKDFKVFDQVAEYYIFDPKAVKLERVKLNKKDILGALKFVPNSEAKANEMGVDYTMEAGVISLVQTLNAQ
jgi:hypothetical protein